MNRLDLLAKRLAASDEGEFIALAPASPPPHTETLEVADMMVRAGVDVLEIAVPSVFPWMEGATMQRHQLEAIAQRVTPAMAFDGIQCVRKRYPGLPLVAISFTTRVFSYGQRRFVESCARTGTDGVDIPDYPLVRSGDVTGFGAELSGHDIHFINPISTDLAMVPESTPEYHLLEGMVRSASGFLFIMAVAGGVSGVKPRLPVETLKPATERVRALQEKLAVSCPIIIVCGISTPEQVHASIEEVGADGVMLGSAVSRRLQAGESLESVESFVRSLKDATRR